jgi:demethylmenaquinone methyltransferase/2-methoxy-6-polyprenyl-1,4-benzoquinol methylase
MVAKIAESVSHLPHPRLLDVATGTADVALLLARALPEAQIVGVDPSRHMLHIGRQKVEQRGYRPETIRLLVHDAQDDFANVLLPPLNSDNDDGMAAQLLFDGATMSFGIRNVPDRAKALCQIHRALREGARLCILEFSEPDDDAGFLGAVARLFIRHVVPILGGLLSGKPREYWHLQHSIQDFPSPREFGMLLTNLSESCDDGAYRLEELVQMNFGSVQLYVTTVVRNHRQAESATQLLEKNTEES